MIKLKSFKNKHFLIIGMGITGISVSNSLLKGGANVYFWDDDLNKRKALRKKGYHLINDKNITNIEYIMPSPSIVTAGKNAHKYIKRLKSKKCKIISELDLFQLYINSINKLKKIKIIGITGTNGKSTTVSMIHHSLKKNNINSVLIGNIGKPIFSSKKLNHGVYILELSSYQLELAKIFKPDISCILNLTPDHLDRHITMHKYATAKCNIFQNISARNICYYDSNKNIKKIATTNLDKKKLKRLIPVKKISSSFKNNKKISLILKKHNMQNLYFSFLILKKLGLKSSDIYKSFSSFSGLPHRQEILVKRKNLIVINDSKSTNLESLVPALNNYKNIILICGGQIKSNKINILNKNRHNVIKAIVIGETKNIFFNYFNKYVDTSYVKNLNKAVKMSLSIANIVNEHCTILFSPGAASFDQYNNFEERGDDFRRKIKAEILK